MNTGTILIVDDNKGVLASLELLLENYFSKILTASNPNQITALLTTRRMATRDFTGWGTSGRWLPPYP